MEKIKTIYLIRHSEQLRLTGNIKLNEDEQIQNEKIVLSCNRRRKSI